MKTFNHGGKVWKNDNPDQYMDFSANLNPAGPPKEMLEGMIAGIRDIQYYPDISMKTASSGIADFLGVREESLLPSNGGISALFLTGLLLQPDTVNILQPSFVEYEHVAFLYKAHVNHINILSERHEICFDPEAIKAHITKNSITYICNPSNPLGCIIKRKSLEKILETAALSKASVVIDEAFIDFIPEASMREYIYEYPGLFIAGSLTKIFAVPGLRLGYLLSHPMNIEKLRNIQAPWVLNSFAVNAIKALSLLDGYMKKSLSDNQLERDLLKRSLESIGFFVFDSFTNYLFVDSKPLGITIPRLEHELGKINILIRSCSDYHGLDEYFARIAVKDRKSNNKLIHALANYFRQGE